MRIDILIYRSCVPYARIRWSNCNQQQNSKEKNHSDAYKQISRPRNDDSSAVFHPVSRINDGWVTQRSIFRMMRYKKGLKT